MMSYISEEYDRSDYRHCLLWSYNADGIDRQS